MADDIDQAQHYDEMFREQALAAHFNSLREGAGLHPLGAVPAACIDCGEDIEPARMQAAPFARRCIACQEQYERMNGRR